LRALLRAVATARDVAVGSRGRALPVLLKLAPDLEDADLDDAVDAAQAAGIDGIIATNTTLRRDGVPPRWATEAGGLSGAPLTGLATAFLRRLRQRAPSYPLIGVGGIMSGDDARRRIDAGADLVQLYTGLVYGGPSLVGDVVRATR
jgi:dihydroorotate dehydrogenase